jgi:serine/tyrosine/threonine adenylyltransferase
MSPDTHVPQQSVSLAGATFDNSFIRELPADPLEDNIPRQVREAAYTRVMPTPVKTPKLLSWSDDVAAMLGLAAPGHDEAEILGGSALAAGMAPYAARYGGHQFGNWAGQLGDGRAITLGELITPDRQRFELQLKGAGRTPYSRTADGRAVLRSSVREFLCSEAMHHLGVPTTRALSLVGTGEDVWRDMFYDGHPATEPGAVVCRVAPTFIRFGNFEILLAHKEPEIARRLADWVIETHYPHLTNLQGQARGVDKYAAWFEEICHRTALMVAHWMRVGFVHGVMNTDNMSILGLTIDYGPYGWLEGVDFEWTPNTTDAEGRRYAYGRQPAIAHWNLVRLANALSQIIEDPEALNQGLTTYESTFDKVAKDMLAAKLGLHGLTLPDDVALLSRLAEVLTQVETDFTIFFRELAKVPVEPDVAANIRNAPLAAALYAELSVAQHEALAAWLGDWASRIRAEGRPEAERIAAMNAVNPKYVPRNYLAQQVIDALTAGDDSVLKRLMQMIRRPYDEQPEFEDLYARRPEWARHKAGCSALSCSS